MSGIFGVDVAGIILDAFNGQLHAATLHKITQTTDDYGAPVKTELQHAAEGVRLKWKAETAVARGYPLDAAKILLLQNGIPQVSTDDEVTIGGDRWRVIDAMKDPVDATWTLAGVMIDPADRPGTPGGTLPPSVTVAPVYLHTQAAASTVWTINHNLGFRPDVSLTTLGGVEFEADVTHTSDTQCIVTLTSPLAGYARCT